MITIKLVNFKCHVDTTYTFKIDEMTLLKGPSGIGKSSLLQGLYWGLYGSLRNVYNNTSKIKKCSVTIQINNWTVYRQKGPELFRVTIDDKPYEDIVAQQIINNAFGNKELWRACSYIEQGSRCVLLAGSAAEKMNMLNQLSFSQDNPKEYIARISKELKTVNEKFISDQATFKTNLSHYTKNVQERPVRLKLEKSELEELKVYLSQLKLSITSLHNKLLEQERFQGILLGIDSQIKSITASLADIEKEIYVLPEESEESLRSRLAELIHMQKDIQEVKRIKDRLQEIQRLKAELGTIPNSDGPITEQDIWSAERVEAEYNQNLQLCQKLGTVYNRDVINGYIQSYQGQVDQIRKYQKYVPLYSNLQKLQAEYSQCQVEIDEKIDEVINENIDEKLQTCSSRLADMEKSRNLLQCPACAEYVRYTGGKLVHKDGEYYSPDQISQAKREYQDLVDKSKQIKRVINLQAQIASLEADIPDIDGLQIYMSSNQNSQAEAILNALKNIKIVDLPNLSSSQMKTVLKFQRLIEEEEKLNPTDISTIDFDVNHEINKVRNTLNTIIAVRNKIIARDAKKDQLEKQLASYLNQKDSLLLDSTVTSQYNDAKKELVELESRISDAEYGNRMMDVRTALEEERGNLLLLQKDLTALERLKHTAVQVECRQLEDTIATINNSLADILPRFFDDPITMKLMLHKVLKSKKVKPGLNICIKYKGVEYDNVNQLSGGEGDRISLSLLLALNQVSSSPVILLDECISSLDDTLKEACIEVINGMKGKAIICVDHGSTEGFYDKVVKI